MSYNIGRLNAVLAVSSSQFNTGLDAAVSKAKATASAISNSLSSATGLNIGGLAAGPAGIATAGVAAISAAVTEYVRLSDQGIERIQRLQGEAKKLGVSTNTAAVFEVLGGKSEAFGH